MSVEYLLTVPFVAACLACAVYFLLAIPSRRATQARTSPHAASSQSLFGPGTAGPRYSFLDRLLHRLRRPVRILAGLVLLAMTFWAGRASVPYEFHSAADGALWRCNRSTGDAFYCSHSYLHWRPVQ